MNQRQAGGMGDELANAALIGLIVMFGIALVLRAAGSITAFLTGLPQPDAGPHEHYLKGTVFCGQCGSRLIVCNAKSSQGTISTPTSCARAGTEAGAIARDRRC